MLKVPLRVRGCCLGKSGGCGRGFGTTGRRGGYEDTVGNLRIGRETRVIFQGFTGLFVFYFLSFVFLNCYSKTPYEEYLSVFVEHAHLYF